MWTGLAPGCVLWAANPSSSCSAFRQVELSTMSSTALQLSEHLHQHHTPCLRLFHMAVQTQPQHPWIECKHPAEFQSASGLGDVSPDLPVHKVVFVHHGQASSNLTRHPLQQHYLRLPPNVLLLIADVSFQVTLEKKLKIFISLICWVNQKNLFLIKIQLTTLLICHIYAQ